MNETYKIYLALIKTLNYYFYFFSGEVPGLFVRPAAAAGCPPQKLQGQRSAGHEVRRHGLRTDGDHGPGGPVARFQPEEVSAGRSDRSDRAGWFLNLAFSIITSFCPCRTLNITKTFFFV